MKTLRPRIGLLFPLGAALLLLACSSEPAFIEACRDECACTGGSAACAPSRSGGCDNSYRRAWTLAAEKSASCQAAYEAYFACLAAKSVCTGTPGAMGWAPPTGQCDAVERPYRDCQ